MKYKSQSEISNYLDQGDMSKVVFTEHEKPLFSITIFRLREILMMASIVGQC